MAKEIILYTAELCGDCQHLKTFMAKHDIRYEERDIHAHPEHAETLESNTGKLGVPYVVIDGEWVRGYQPGKPFSDDFAKTLFDLS